MDQLAEPQRKIRAALLRGEVITTSKGNRMGQTTETRKIISRLRRSGMEIYDRWVIEGSRRWKEYCHIVPDTWISKVS